MRKMSCFAFNIEKFTMIPVNLMFRIFHCGYIFNMLGIANILKIKEIIYEN